VRQKLAQRVLADILYICLRDAGSSHISEVSEFEPDNPADQRLCVPSEEEFELLAAPFRVGFPQPLAQKQARLSTYALVAHRQP
jgi:hypothetical protein